MNREALYRTLERAQALLLPLPTVEGALARREVDASLAGDPGIFDERLRAIIGGQDADGSWDGGVDATAAALLELDELAEGLLPPELRTGFGRSDPDAAYGQAGTVHEPERSDAPIEDLLRRSVPAGLAWLKARRGGPGRFGEGCAPGWHLAELCEHTISEFHAPAAEEARDPDALVVTSARATEAALRWGETAGVASRHVAELRRVVAHCAWPRGDSLLKASSLVAAIGALLRAPVTVENVRSIAEGIALLVRTQRADGTWHGVTLYDAVELLLTGIPRGYHVPEVDAALARSAQLLVLTQKSNGTWGAESGARQPLVAWRVLRHATGFTAGLEPAAV